MDQFGKSQKVVIVDDNVALADIYKTRLQLLGYSCSVAYDGIDALALIKKELPDLVLLDLMVPKIAGDQILEIMRRSDWGKNIKVMIISNLDEADATPGLREQGIEGYAVKANLSNDQIDQLVDSILKPAGQTEDIDSLEQPEPMAPLPVPQAPATTTSFNDGSAPAAAVTNDSSQSTVSEPADTTPENPPAPMGSTVN